MEPPWSIQHTIQVGVSGGGYQPLDFLYNHITIRYAVRIRKVIFYIASSVFSIPFA